METVKGEGEDVHTGAEINECIFNGKNCFWLPSSPAHVSIIALNLY